MPDRPIHPRFRSKRRPRVKREPIKNSQPTDVDLPAFRQADDRPTNRAQDAHTVKEQPE